MLNWFKKIFDRCPFSSSLPCPPFTFLLISPWLEFAKHLDLPDTLCISFCIWQFQTRCVSLCGGMFRGLWMKTERFILNTLGNVLFLPWQNQPPPSSSSLTKARCGTARLFSPPFIFSSSPPLLFSSCDEKRQSDLNASTKVKFWVVELSSIELYQFLCSELNNVSWR